MRRWQAIPVAAIVALAMGAIMFTRTPGTAQAGVPTQVEFYLDCGSGLGANCTLPSGTTSLDIGAYIQNNTGGPIVLTALGLVISDDNQPAFAPNVPGSCVAPAFDCNPDFNQVGLDGAGSGWNCGSPAPVPDQNASATVAESNLACNTGSTTTPAIADGGTLLLATVHYTTTDGVANFSFNSTGVGNGALVFDDSFSELGTCGPVVAVDANCFGVTVQIGASAATNTPVPTSTPTAPPTSTPTPCVGGGCPTATSEAFKTVTPTPGGETATPAPAATTAPGGEQPGTGEQPGAAPGGEQPGGNTGAGGARPIRLPDTGSSNSSSNGSLLLALLATAGVGLAAGGLYFGAAAVADKRRRDGGR